MGISIFVLLSTLLLPTFLFAKPCSDQPTVFKKPQFINDLNSKILPGSYQIVAASCPFGGADAFGVDITADRKNMQLRLYKENALIGTETLLTTREGGEGHYYVELFENSNRSLCHFATTNYYSVSWEFTLTQSPDALVARTKCHNVRNTSLFCPKRKSECTLMLKRRAH